MTNQARQRLAAHVRETRLLGSIHGTLYWDQNTLMPSAGAAWRGEQLALLARQLHERQSSAAYADILAAAEAELGARPATDPWRQNLALLRRDLERQRLLDPALVAALSLARTRGYALWQEARSQADHARFAPALAELIALRQEQARQLATVERDAEGRPRSCWEILAQPFEPGISKARLATLFKPLGQRLPPLIERHGRQVSAGIDPHQAVLSDTAQERLCQQLLQEWGFDPSQAVLARSPHPFSTTLGPADFRITSRIVPGQPFSAFLATAHEWGHSLYEQGLPRHDQQWFAWPLGDATSMGVHESQSLFWECRVGRGEAFARRWQPRFRQAIERQTARNAGQSGAQWQDPAAFWRELNPRRPGLIRVESDELSYCLHILLRYELELALLEGGLSVQELPAEWNRRMLALLGIAPGNDAEGCLQDVHWSEGLFGYFPSYALGHLISAQLAEAMEREIGPIEARLTAGDDRALLDWLRLHVHPLGRSVTGEELVLRVSGARLDSSAFLTYLEAKLEKLSSGHP
ncbi:MULTISPECIES: carboxypeptidase M32 [unclassified Synechococcus]|uniref:carboxypeptidase M32 n=1 Tax=unclassified Synechococcus TaxID=2626047 RepID=UPI0021A4F941|nr:MULTISPECIES: carboxypeptidase M32 [unclassified Synechococcus]MCT0212990.1 carboxypeptidase M32 [Synechococcus sp. CS-1326]MCT0232234.1 carboxypeptidase M32 [Synechococcus sp. CS-1327]